MKDKKLLKYIITSAIVFVLGIVLDQVTKVIAHDLLSNANSVEVLGSWLTLTYVENSGSSFGMFKGMSVMFFVITLIGLPFFCFLWWRSKNRSIVSKIGYTFILSGTVGNAIDRFALGDGFFNGAVRDFISVKGFAVFNVADSLLTVGVAFAILGLLFFDFDALFDFHKKAESKEGNIEQYAPENEQESAVSSMKHNEKEDAEQFSKDNHCDDGNKDD